MRAITGDVQLLGDGDSRGAVTEFDLEALLGTSLLDADITHDALEQLANDDNFVVLYSEAAAGGVLHYSLQGCLLHTRVCVIFLCVPMSSPQQNAVVAHINDKMGTSDEPLLAASGGSTPARTLVVHPGTTAAASSPGAMSPAAPAPASASSASASASSARAAAIAALAVSPAQPPRVASDAVVREVMQSITEDPTIKTALQPRKRVAQCLHVSRASAHTVPLQLWR